MTALLRLSMNSQAIHVEKPGVGNAPTLIFSVHRKFYSKGGNYVKTLEKVQKSVYG